MSKAIRQISLKLSTVIIRLISNRAEQLLDELGNWAGIELRLVIYLFVGVVTYAIYQ